MNTHTNHRHTFGTHMTHGYTNASTHLHAEHGQAPAESAIGARVGTGDNPHRLTRTKNNPTSKTKASVYWRQRARERARTVPKDTNRPTKQKTNAINQPINQPTNQPTTQQPTQPTNQNQRTDQPTNQPAKHPTSQPTNRPIKTNEPANQPSILPTSDTRTNNQP